MARKIMRKVIPLLMLVSIFLISLMAIADAKVFCQGENMVLQWALPSSLHKESWSEACNALCSEESTLCSCNSEGNFGNLYLSSTIPASALATYRQITWSVSSRDITMLKQYVNSIANVVEFIGNPLFGKCYAIKENLEFADSGVVTSGLLDLRSAAGFVSTNIGTLLDPENLELGDAQLRGVISFNGNSRTITLNTGDKFSMADVDNHITSSVHISNKYASPVQITYVIGGIRTGYIRVYTSSDLITKIEKFFNDLFRTVHPIDPILTVSGPSMDIYYYGYKTNTISNIRGTIGLYKLDSDYGYIRALKGTTRFHVLKQDELLLPFDGNVDEKGYYDLINGRVIGYSYFIESNGEKKEVVSELFDENNKISIAALPFVPPGLINENKLKVTTKEASYGDVKVVIDNTELIS